MEGTFHHDWHALLLLEHVAGAPLQLFLPDTVVFNPDGQICEWMYSNADGFVTRKQGKELHIRDVRNKFFKALQRDVGNYSCYVAIAYYRHGSPKLLRRHAFSELCHSLEKRLVSTEVEKSSSLEIPDALQSYVQPLLDVIYTTTYVTNSGIPISDTSQTSFTSTVLEPAQPKGRKANTPVNGLPSPTVHISSALKQKLRHIVLSIAAHFRKLLSDPPRHFVVCCIRDARSCFCIMGISVIDHQSPRLMKRRYSVKSSSSDNEYVALGSSETPFTFEGDQASTALSGDMEPSRTSSSNIVRTERYSARSPSSKQHLRYRARAQSAPLQRPLEYSREVVGHQKSQVKNNCHISPTCPQPPSVLLRGNCPGELARSNHTSPTVHVNDRRGDTREEWNRERVIEAVENKGIPRVIEMLSKELRILRNELVFQQEVIESHSRRANKAEGELQALQRTYNARIQKMQQALEDANSELADLKLEKKTTANQASSAMERARTLDARVRELLGTIDSERATTVKALGEYQDRDGALGRKLEGLETELSLTRGQLKQEQAVVVALKKQALAFQEELQQVQKEHPPKTIADAGVLDILASIRQLLDKEANPAGERYAVQKTIVAYSTELRSTFLFYCQLDTSFANHWPPSMHQHQWLAFCRDSETADPRSGVRVRGTGAIGGALPISEAQEAFDIFASLDNESREYSTLPYEGFVGALIWISSRLKQHNVTFLSEAFRNYILKFLNRARKVQPAQRGSGVAKLSLHATTTLPTASASLGGPGNSATIHRTKSKK